MQVLSVLTGQRGVRDEHFLELGIRSAVQPDVGELAHRSAFFLSGQLRERFVRHVLFENLDPFEFAQNFINAGVPLSGLFLKQSQDQTVHLGRDVRIEFRGIRRRSREMLSE